MKTKGKDTTGISRISRLVSMLTRGIINESFNLLSNSHTDIEQRAHQKPGLVLTGVRGALPNSSVIPVWRHRDDIFMNWWHILCDDCQFSFVTLE